MRDPYEVLGVSKTATDDEIKRAYREKAKKFHPDNFADDANAREMAEEKMKDINEAYDSIMNMRRDPNAANNNAGGYSAYSNSNFSEIRNLISANKIEDALKKLDQVPVQQRNAEWYFLIGSVQFKRGWFDNAYTSFSTACRMDPANPEYRAALNQIQYSRGGFNPYRHSGGRGTECSTCDACCGLMCADSCCECMGGDLCACC